MTISKTRLLLAVLASTLMTACNRMPPECSDLNVLSTLKSIDADILQRESGFTHLKFAADSFETSDPHTLSIDEKVKTRSCAVSMKYKITDSSWSLWNAPDEDPRLNTVAIGFAKATPVLEVYLSNNGGRMELDMVNMTLNAVKAEGKDTLAAAGGIDNQRLSLGSTTVNYTVRLNEDKSKNSPYFVETAIPKTATKAISFMESVSEIIASSAAKQKTAE